MSRRLAIAIAATCLTSCAVIADAQVQRPPVAQLRQAMEKLGWMIGEWQGSGWVESASRGRQQFSYTLHVRSEFDGLVLVVDGVGFDRADASVSYAEHLLIEGPPPAVLPGPPGTYSWKELASSGWLHWNEAQGTDRSLQVGFPLIRQACDRILDDSHRAFCLVSASEFWSRATISLNDRNEWVETREWQISDSDVRTWTRYFEVVLRRVK